MDDFEILRKELVAKVLSDRMNYTTRRFCLNYKGDQMEAAKNAGIGGQDSSIRSRISRIKKEFPKIVDYMSEVDKLKAECISKKHDAIMKSVNTKDIVHNLFTAKDDMDLSWCNATQAQVLLHYTGSLVQAARLAGVAQDEPPAERETKLRKAVHNMMRDEQMRDAVAELDRIIEEQVVMSAVRAKVLLTEFAEDDGLDIKDRQAAITTILKSHGELHHGNTINIDNKKLEISILGVGHVIDENGQPKQITDDGIIDVTPTLDDLL